MNLATHEQNLLHGMHTSEITCMSYSDARHMVCTGQGTVSLELQPYFVLWDI